MFFDRFLKPKATETAGRALYAAAVAQARQPGYYETLAVPDTVEGRFELYSLQVFLLLDRLRRQGAQAADTAQTLFDTYVSALDDALREMGVGDIVIGKKMRKLGEAFYGRVKSYETAFAAMPDDANLKALLLRTVYDQGGGEAAPRLAQHIVAQREFLAGQGLDRLLDGHVEWAAP
jgi:cytochrome b pre-mRNA-processing protein 3